MTNFQVLINNAIRILRENTGLSQEKFSEKCGLSVEGYRNIEHNRYTPKSITIDKICDAFNLTPVELLYIGMDLPSQDNKDKIINRIASLNDTQLNMLNDFIDLIQGYSVADKK